MSCQLSYAQADLDVMQTLNRPHVGILGMDIAWGAGSLFAIAVSGLSYQFLLLQC